MNIDKLLSRLLLFCIPLYFTQGWIFVSGGTISQILVGIWALIDFFYLGKYLFLSNRTILGNTFILFWGLMVLYWLFSPRLVQGAFSVINTFGDFKNATLFSLSFFPFFYWKNQGFIDEKYFRVFSLFFLLSSILAYQLQNKGLIDIYGTAVTNNTAYYFIMIIPFLGFWGLRKGFYLLFIVIVYFVLLCAKRGAIICAAVTLLIFLVLIFQNNSSKRQKKQAFWGILGIGVIVVLAIFVYSSNELLQLRMEDTQEGNSSNRDYIYSRLWQVFLSGRTINKVIGYGMSQTVYYADGYAHSDWLELLIDEGLIGISLYATFFISGIVLYRRYKKDMSVQARFTFLTGLLCLMVRSIFSMGFMAPETSLLCISLAVSLPSNNSKSNVLCQVS